jgi:hypothetical protein
VKLLGLAERTIVKIVRVVILLDADFEVKTGEGETGSRDAEIFPAPEAP